MHVKQIIKAAHDKLKVHRWIAWLLCAALMVSMVSSTLPALAVDGENKENTLCEHHPEHTEECGYVEAVEGQPCTHEHDENCGYAEAVEGNPCNHSHDESCGAEGQDCTHSHDENCGYAEAVESQPCIHEHDENCGYVEAVEGQPCQFVCEICGGGSEEVTDEETEQDVAVMADEPMAMAAANEKGLIAEFTFNDVKDRLKNSANGSGVTAEIHEVNSGVENDPGDIIESDSGSWARCFNGTGEDTNALHLEDTACLVLKNTDAFKGLTELTVEMRVKITGTQQHQWLFYARRGSTADDCLGAAILDTNKTFRAIRGNTLKWVEWKPSGDVLTVDEWHAIRVVYKISTMAIYIDGKRVNEEGAGGRTAYYFENSPDIWLGHSAFKDTNFKGYIDDIKIYNYAKDDYPINEEQYIVESVEPPGTTVHMFDYWITEQEDNDYNPLSLDLDGVRNGKINKGHLLLFAGWDAANGQANSEDAVGSWNAYQYKETVNGRVNHRSWEPFPGIVNNVLVNGYPQLSIEGLKKSGMFKSPKGDWYDRNADKADESLAYLFKPKDDFANGKAAYPNVTGLFQLDEEGYYNFKCAKTFAELNRNQTSKPKKSTGNNRITLYQRSTEYKDFFPFNDATDLFYINMDDKLNKANINQDGSPDMKTQATTDEPINHYFGMTVETTFEQTTDGKIDLPGGDKTDMNFRFSGDDDVWIFIDDVLVADVGGVHNEIDVNINFATGEIDFTGYDTLTETGKTTVDNLDGKYANGSGKIFDTTLREVFKKAYEDNGIAWNENKWNENNPELFADGTRHTLKFFYLERGNNVSRCTIEFNLHLVELPPDGDDPTAKRSKKDKIPEEQVFIPTEQPIEESVTLNVSTGKPPEDKEEKKAVGVLASPNTGDSNMVGLWFTLLMLSTAGLAAIYRTRKRGSK